LEPKVQSATPEQIYAMLPPELREKATIDKDATGRLAQLSDLTKSFDWKKYADLADPHVAMSSRKVNARAFYTDTQPLFAKARAILAQGPLQETPYKPQDMVHMELFSSLRAIVKYCASSGKLLAADREYDKATEMTEFGMDLADHLLKCRGSGITWLVAIAMDSIMLRSGHELASLPGFPPADCKRLLAVLPAAPTTDEPLRNAIRTDFQDDMAPNLGSAERVWQFVKPGGEDLTEDDLKRLETVVGNYDPSETVKMLSKEAKEEMDNTRRPMAQMAHQTDAQIEKLSNSTPKDPDLKPNASAHNAWESFKFKLTMNASPNSLGRRLLASSDPGRNLPPISCRNRALRDCLRVYLASIVYRSTHGGALPSSIRGSSRC